jgi:hypothetical protein
MMPTMSDMYDGFKQWLLGSKRAKSAIAKASDDSGADGASEIGSEPAKYDPDSEPALLLEGCIAFVSCDNAKCNYDPSLESPARVIPPYGSEVLVLKIADEWALIEFVGKRAWTPTSQIAAKAPKSRFNIEPYIVRPVYGTPIQSDFDEVEFGPRGGRFTRTRSGHRRYF